MADHKLVGKNYTTPDLLAKVTGKAKFAEDFRAEGMLFARLLLSPYPHARIRSIDASAALAMPGVKAIVTPDDVPPPADLVTDLGVTIKANLKGERTLAAGETVYYGEPVLAVAAVDELTAAEAIERIQIDWEPLPFNVDPLDALRAGRPNPRVEGNVWVRPAPKPDAPPPNPEVQEIKWTAQEFAASADGRLPFFEAAGSSKGKVTDEWSFGDLEAGFKNAALVLDETFVTPNTNHETLEPRTVMSYWQNGKVHVYCSTQSVTQTVAAVARWLHVEPTDVVIISPYTGGGFGSKITGTVQYVIPALLSKKANAPVMMRISREEEHFIGGARPSLHARLKVGFSKEGKILALDMFAIGENGPFEQGGDTGQSGRIVSLMYQPAAMRFRGISPLTNTPPRRAQSAPGGMQGIGVMEPLLAKAARQLGVDQVAIRKINAPSGKAPIGPPNPRGQRAYITSSFIKEALDRGAESFKWEERKARTANKEGSKVRGVGVAVSTFVAGSTGFDGLLIIKPDGRLYMHTGVGNLGTESMSDSHRVGAEMLGMPWEKCELVWGDTSQHLPWSCISGGSQTLHATTRAVHAAASDAVKKLQEIAAKSLGGRPEDFEIVNERVARKGGGAGMTLAQAAQKAIDLGGKFDGHELPQNINGMTKTSATALAGQGLMGVARDTYPRDGQTHSFVAGFAEVEVDRETGKFHILDYLAVGDVGTVIHPNSLGGQLLGRSMMGVGHAISQKWVYDQHYGVPLAKRLYHTKPLTILDIPQKMAWDAVNIPDPETPVGARGIGEPPVGAGMCAVLNALQDAIGDKVFTRAPVYLDTILQSLEAGHPTQDPLTAHI
jgi:xanthine dehydrogenase molybdenum-binding subunit